jgi:hypothetical protein
MNFGVLRVLNDDIVDGGRGFRTHPHDNMEIVSIPLEGDLEHKDSMGNVSVIREGDIQVMSAGTGVYHSEYNKNKDQKVRFLQIWMFPRQKHVAPRYDQVSIKEITAKNEISQILSPFSYDNGVWVHQDTWFHLADFNAGNSRNYKLKDPENGVYTFVIEGSVEVNGQLLSKRDGYGVWNMEELNYQATGNARFLVMEVPMKL